MTAESLDDDSSYSNPDDQSWISINADTYPHVYEGGRRYQAINGQYTLPNDEHECEREMIAHEGFKIALGRRLYLAPIGDNPQRILDLGTGYGLWAFEIADKFPAASVTGVDLSAVQPSYVPSNLCFTVGDMEKKEQCWSALSFQDLDFIFARETFKTIENPQGVLSSAFRSLKPGGWIELQEWYHRLISDVGEPMPPGYAPERFLELVSECYQTFRPSSDIYRAGKFKSLLEEAGFVNISVNVFNLPIGHWPQDQLQRQIGVFTREASLRIMPAVSTNFSRAGYDRVTPDELEGLVAECRQAFFSTRVRACMPYYIVYGQKPTAT